MRSDPAWRESHDLTSRALHEDFQFLQEIDAVQILVGKGYKYVIEQSESTIYRGTGLSSYFDFHFFFS